MNEFYQQLSAVKGEITTSMTEFPDLSPEAKRECQKKLDQTVKTLLKIQKDLVEADKPDPDARVVQVLGLNAQFGAKASDFEHSFSSAKGHPKMNPGFISDGLLLTMERNYMLDGSGKVLPGTEDEFYITFRREEDASYVLGLQSLTLRYANVGRTVGFTQPAKNLETRATFRKIGALVKRVRAIEGELKAMGAVWEGDGYKPGPKYVDKSWFVTSIAGMKRAREAGLSIDRHVYGALKGRKPVDMAKLEARIKTLYDEECDALIALREFQLSGVEFDF